MRSLLLLILLVSFVSTSIVAEDDSCETTSQVTLRSCQLSANSHFWLAEGKCVNDADSAKRAVCKQRASTASSDALATCRDQFSARQAVCERLPDRAYDPVIDPRNFSDKVDNPYFPLNPGTTFIYESQTPEGLEHNEVFVTHETRTILGVTCVEVHDTVRLNGKLTEDTLDWYAQDRDGNVWYFGENSKTLDGGLVVSLQGSWTAGVGGARQGIIMEAHPAVGDFYRQEFLLGTAEDVASVLSLDSSATVPAGTFHHSLKTRDTSPLEPDVVEDKFYAPGIGVVLENDQTAKVKSRLIRIKSE